MNNNFTAEPSKMVFITLNCFSPVLHCENKIAMLVPDNDALPARPTRVLYLLHGGEGSCMDWVRFTNIERYVCGKNIAVVMPSAGPSRWNNMAMGEDYSDYLVKDLPRRIKKLFPYLSSAPEDTFIAGLSMGGGGALTNAMLYPENYAACGVLSTSSVVPFEHLRPTGMKPPAPGGEGKPSVLELQLGVKVSEEASGTDWDVVYTSKRNVAEGKRLPRIFHACGMKDHAYPAALALRDHFMSFEGNPYRYELHTTETGRHNWDFWDTWIKHFVDTLGEGN